MFDNSGTHNHLYDRQSDNPFVPMEVLLATFNGKDNRKKISGNNFIACAIFNIAKKDIWVKNVVYQSWETIFFSFGEKTSTEGLGELIKITEFLEFKTSDNCIWAFLITF